MTEHDENAVVDLLMAAALMAKLCEDPAERRRTIAAALKPGDRLPGGLRVVPEEPTGEQLSEGGLAMVRDKYVGYIYRAMIAAATTNARGQNDTR